ncbi:MAG TPA: carboxypeptidase regulatory-like domain-containing protein, partial [Terriglobales bacterium]|nr:carboxypeptidase regulatory-like domain-containing protein [Terriglobales bacterium]
MQKRRISFFMGVVLICTALLWAALPALGQEITAGVTGTVADPSGAPIVGASITATDVDRGTNWKVQTNEVGVYNLVRLPVGRYKLQVEAKGFQTAQIAPFTLVMNQTGKIDIAMKVGQVSDVIEITDAAPVLQTETTQLSNLIDSKTTTELPLATRNFLQLTLLSPGAVTTNPTEFTTGQMMAGSGRPYINGNREQANNIMLDGVDYTDRNNNEVGFSPPPDAIQEFNIITQNPSAEFGDFAGGIINTTIKSGTNQFHGSVWEFLRNDVLNANSWSNKLAAAQLGVPADTYKSKIRWNVYGGAVGGPIIKNKLFFFADYQGLRQDTPKAAASSSVFTDAERAGNFGALCTEAGGTFNGSGICSNAANQLVNPANGNPIPNNNLAAAGLTINPVAAALFASSAYPKAQIQSGPGIAAGIQPNFTSYYSTQLNNDQGDIKLDYVMSDKDKLYGRYSRMYGENPSLYTYALYANQSSPQTQPANNLALDWTHVISPNVVNDARVGWNVLNYIQTGSNATTPLGNFAEDLGIGGGNDYAPGMLQINFAGAPNFNLGTAAIDQQFHSTTITASDSLIVTHGRHQFQTGFQFWRLRVDDTYSGNSGLLGILNISNLTGSSMADFWLGDVQNGTRGTSPFTFGRRGNILAAYAQDTWKVTPHLTINYGLRFEDHFPQYEIHNREVNFGLYSGAIIPQTGQKSLINNYLGIGDWQPRIGIAWSPAFLHDKTVVRLSYGVSSYGEGGGANQQLTQNLQLPSSSVGATTLNSSAIFGPPGTACVALDNTCFVGRNIKVW